jgi:hypothetical protein
MNTLSQAVPTRARTDALLVTGWTVLIGLLLLRWAQLRPTDWLRFVLFILAAGCFALAVLLFYRIWLLYTLRYEIDRNAVVVRWRRSRVVIPLSNIQRVLQKQQDAVRTSGWWRWPASFIRIETNPEGGLLVMAATQPLSACLLLDTQRTVYALSPLSEHTFLQALQQAYQLGPTAAVSLDDSQTFDLRLLLGVDRLVRAVLLAGLGGVVLLFALLMIRYPSLPDTMTVRFNSSGLPDLIRPKSGLFLLPTIGLAVWLVNSLGGIIMAAYSQLTGAYLLWSGSIIVQIFLLFALLNLVR